LQTAIQATGAGRVIVTHGSVEPMVRWLREQGLEAGAFDTQYGDDTVEADAAGADETAPLATAEAQSMQTTSIETGTDRS
jgi:putative mRNA 3-end processing factor